MRYNPTRAYWREWGPFYVNVHDVGWQVSLFSGRLAWVGHSLRPFRLVDRLARR